LNVAAKGKLPQRITVISFLMSNEISIQRNEMINGASKDHSFGFYCGKHNVKLFCLTHKSFIKASAASSSPFHPKNRPQT
jgi:hypothetical protein